jgi:hypothetical protein
MFKKTQTQPQKPRKNQPIKIRLWCSSSMAVSIPQSPAWGAQGHSKRGDPPPQPCLARAPCCPVSSPCLPFKAPTQPHRQSAIPQVVVAGHRKHTRTTHTAPAAAVGSRRAHLPTDTRACTRVLDSARNCSAGNSITMLGGCSRLLVALGCCAAHAPAPCPARPACAGRSWFFLSCSLGSPPAFIPTPSIHPHSLCHV